MQNNAILLGGERVGKTALCSCCIMGKPVEENEMTQPIGNIWTIIAG